jgi:ATP-dependent Lon protease
MTETTQNLSTPIVPLRGGAVFPGVTTTISIGRRKSLAAAQAALEEGGEMLIVVQYRADIEEPGNDDLAHIGIRASVRDLIRTPHIGVQMLVELHERVGFIELSQREPYLRGIFQELPEQEQLADQELILETLAYLEQYAEALGEVNQQIIVNARSKDNDGELADYIAGILNLPFETELELLTTLDGRLRLELILEHLQQELRITEIRNQIQQDAREGADKAQREFLLREQLRSIR